jgi:uncharacterized protein YggE
LFHRTPGRNSLSRRSSFRGNERKNKYVVGEHPTGEEKDKKISIIVIVGSVFLAILLLGIGTLIGRSLYEPKTVVLNTNGEQSNSLTKYSQTQSTIAVVGESKLDVKPEIALINFGLCDPDAGTANQAVNERLATLIAGLQAAGFDKKSTVPSNFALTPQNYNGLQITSYCATNQVDVTTANLDEVSSILDKAIASGATNVYGINFMAKNEESVSQKGIQLAFQDAENQAQTLAKSMNESIQGVVSSNVQYKFLYRKHLCRL